MHMLVKENNVLEAYCNPRHTASGNNNEEH